MREFNPKFAKVFSPFQCADLINVPHEDYPKRVYHTWEMIVSASNSPISEITEFDCKSFHSYIMHDMPSEQRGKWRTIDVTVAGHACTPPWMIAGEIQEHGLFPFDFTTIVDDSDIIRWYRQFEIIHPFADGNGRVGGVIAAIASYWFSRGQYYLAPMQ